jgi:hypothetical protein
MSSNWQSVSAAVALAIGLTGSNASLAQENRTSPVNHIHADAHGPLMWIGDDWAVQEWRWTDPADPSTAAFCIVGKRLGSTAVNIALYSDGQVELTGWEFGQGMTDSLAPDEDNAKLELTLGNGAEFAAEASWEYGNYSIDVSDELMSGLQSSDTVLLKLLPTDGTVLFDLAGSNHAFKWLRACAAGLKAGDESREIAAQSAYTDKGVGPVVWGSDSEETRQRARTACQEIGGSSCAKGAWGKVGVANSFITTCCPSAENRCVITVAQTEGRVGQELGFMAGKLAFERAGYSTDRCAIEAVHSATTGERLEITFN